MDVVVTGGNGFVGRHLVGALEARGDRVRVLALPGEKTDDLAARGVHVHRGDVRRPETLPAAMAGADAVVHLAAMMHVWRPLADYRAVNVEGTANVVRAASDAGVSRLVHMSSSAVYGPAAGAPVTEDHPLAPPSDPYARTKAEADRLVLAAARALPVAVLRPDQVFGPGDLLHFGSTASRLMAGRALVVGRGDNALPLVYIDDLVQGLLLALDHPGGPGEAFNITAAAPVTQVQFLTEIASALHVRPPRHHVPYPVLFGAGALVERLWSLVPGDRRPPLTRLGVSFLGQHARFSIDKARRVLGFEPAVPLLEGIRRTAAWYVGQAPLDPAPSAPVAPAPEARSSGRAREVER